MAKCYGIRHRKDGRWFVGFTADRAQRLVWSHDERQAWGGTWPAAEAQAALLVKFRKPALLTPSPLP